MDIKIRDCNLDDLNELLELSFYTFYETFGDVTAKESIDTYTKNAFTRENFKNELLDKNSNFYFVYYKEKLAGYLKLNISNSQTEPMGEEYLEIQRIYLKNEFQGNGLGRLMIEKAFEMANFYKKRYIWLGVWEFNYKAFNFYSKMGFKKVGRHDFFMGEEKQTDYIMEKDLLNS